MPKCISMARARWAAIRPLGVLKRAEYETAFGRRCPRNAGQFAGNGGNGGGLYQAAALLDGIPLDAAAAEYLLADLGCTPISAGGGAGEWDDAALYQARHLVENGFERFKAWRGVATRYAKTAAAYLAMCRIRALAVWAGVV